jgi:hypothetical protein
MSTRMECHIVVAEQLGKVGHVEMIDVSPANRHARSGAPSGG